MIRRSTYWILAAALLAGCEADLSVTVPAQAPVPEPVSVWARPIAYVASQPVTDRDLLGPLIEAAGGQVLSEIVLDRMVSERLAQRGLELTPSLIEHEKSLMLATLSPDADEAIRLLGELRRERGLGEQRFASMLSRNAGLRLLVSDRVQVSTAMLHRAYRLRYGERYRVRIIVADTLQQAKALRDRAVAGEPFGELAALHSTDPSAAQGGLLSLISPDDLTYPKALRDAIVELEPGGVSGLIAVDQRFILVKLREKLPPQPVTFEDAREGLEQSVRLEAQGYLMQQAARSMLAETKVVVLDPALGKSWNASKAETNVGR